MTLSLSSDPGRDGNPLIHTKYQIIHNNLQFIISSYTCTAPLISRSRDTTEPFPGPEGDSITIIYTHLDLTLGYRALTQAI